MMQQEVIVRNDSDKPVTVWYGHTPYFFAPGAAKKINKVIADLTLDHEDYDYLVIEEPVQGESTDEAVWRFNASQAEKDDKYKHPDRDKKTKSWGAIKKEIKDGTWDPLTCDIEEVDMYITKKKLVVDSDADDQTKRDLVDQDLAVE